jgi:hypothetical protein
MGMNHKHQDCKSNGKIIAYPICIFVLVLFGLSFPVFPTSDDIQLLADEAKQRFSSVIKPPIYQYPLVSYVMELEPGIPHRDYVVQSLNEAIETLLQEAEKPNRKETITNALRNLVKNGNTDPIDEVFQEMLRQAQANQITLNPQAAPVCCVG